MAKVLITPVSDQTIPCVSFILQSVRFDKYIFITSDYVEKKQLVEMVIKASKIDTDITEKITVDPESIKACEDVLKASNFDFNNNHYTINITGGTKLTSLSVYNFFTKHNQVCEIFYLPKDKGIFQMIFPNQQDSSYSNIVDLDTYLTAYGVEYSSSQPLCSLSDNIQFRDEIFPYYRDAISEIRKLRNGRKLKKGKKLSADKFNALSDKAKEVFVLCKFDVNNINKKQVDYITGGWFEDYVYINLLSKITPDNIALGLNFKKTENEIDVAYVYNNTLFQIECKTGIKDEHGKSIISETVYKQASLQKDLGLRLKSYLLVYDKVENEKEKKIKRAMDFNIELIDIDKLKGGDICELLLKK